MNASKKSGKIQAKFLQKILEQLKKFKYLPIQIFMKQYKY